MNFVGPFAQSQQNARLFLSNLIFATACSETIKAIQDMQGVNAKLEADGKEEALNANKQDENLFMNIMFTTPLEKEV